MYINIYCTAFLCGKKEKGAALIKGWFLKHGHWVETRGGATVPPALPQQKTLEWLRLTFALGAPWWSGVAQLCGFLQSFER